MRGVHTRILGAAISLLLLTACGLIIPTPDRTGEVRVSWVLRGVAGNRLELGVMTAGADCQRFTDVEVIESDQNVEVRAWVEQLPADSCFMVRLYHPVTVALGSPLGTRTLTGCMIAESAPHDTRETCAELVDS
jgi:hypothetical protein